MTRRRVLALLAVPLLVAAAGCGGGTRADAGTGSLAGKTVTLVVGFEPGGGYDAYARILAPYLEEQLDATVVVENQPGAGGLLAANSLMTAEPDGTTLLILNGPGNLSSAIAEVEGARFDLGALSYIGRIAAVPDIVTVAPDGPYDSWDDLVGSTEPLKIGTTGLGSAAYLNAALLDEIFGLDAELVTGYASSGEAELGLAAGDVDALPGTLDSRLLAIEAGEAEAVLVLAEERVEELPDVPALSEFDLAPDAVELFQAHLQLAAIGRPVVAPPGVPDEILASLRDALAAALADPDLVAEGEQQGRPVNPLSGEELTDLAAQLVDPPPAYRDLLVDAYNQ